MNNYYVYGHYYNGVLFYIGKGIGSRYSSIKNRSESYFYDCKELNINVDNVECKILVNNLTSDNAIALEAFLIDMYIVQGIKLINTHVANLSFKEYKQKHFDQCQKGRDKAKANGVKFGKPSKLTPEQTTDIRSKRLTQPALAKLYNVSVSYVAKIQGSK